MSAQHPVGERCGGDESQSQSSRMRGSRLSFFFFCLCFACQFKKKKPHRVKRGGCGCYWVNQTELERKREREGGGRVVGAERLARYTRGWGAALWRSACSCCTVGTICSDNVWSTCLVCSASQKLVFSSLSLPLLLSSYISLAKYVTQETAH